MRTEGSWRANERLRAEDKQNVKEKKNGYQEAIEHLHNNWDDVPPLMKGAIYVVTGVAVLWASKYVFSAIGGAVSSFRGMLKSFRE